MPDLIKFDTLNTAYVSLAALMRYLPGGVDEFTAELDRIAGVRVI